MGWLARQARSYGWHPVGDALSAQQLANTGALVVAAFANPDPDRPGHIAAIRPSLKTAIELIADGPQETQAGETNALSTTIAAGFRHHRGAWQPGGGGAIRYYAHAVDWSRVAPPGERGGAAGPMSTAWAKSPTIVVFTAGALSREAGFAPFDPDGMPPGLGLEDVVTQDGFARDPARVQEFYNRRRRELLR